MNLTCDKARQFFSRYLPLLQYTYTHYYKDNTKDFPSTGIVHIEVNAGKTTT